MQNRGALGGAGPLHQHGAQAVPGGRPDTGPGLRGVPEDAVPEPVPRSERGGVLSERQKNADGAGQRVLQEHTGAQGIAGGGPTAGFGSEYLPVCGEDGCG